MVNQVMNSHSLLRFFTRLAAVGLIVSLAACGGGGGGGGSTSTSSSNAATYTVSAVAGTGTTITPATLTVQSGQSASFSVGLLSGYSNLVVTGGGGTLSGSTYTTGPITANTTVTASATPIPTHTVTIATGAGVHTPSASISVADGGSVTLPFTLDAGYTNLVVTGGNGTLSGLSYTLTNVTANVTLNASATAPVVTHTITIATGTGVHTPSAAVSVADGGSVTIPFTLDAGYTNLVVTGGNGTLSGLSYTVTNVTANVTLNASATAPVVTHTITIATGTGVHTPSASVSVADGGSVTIPFTLDAGYTNLVVAGGTGTLSGLTYTLSNIKADVALTASATAPLTHTLTIIANAGILKTSATMTVNDGAIATFPFVLDIGYMTPTAVGLNSKVLFQGGRDYNCQTDPVLQDATITLSAVVDNQYALAYIRTDHNALFSTEFNTTPVTMEVRAGGTGFTLYAEYNAALLGLPNSVVKQQLYDDGTHGDKIAGDGIYTAVITFPPASPSIFRYHSNTVGSIRVDVFAYDAGGNQLTSTIPMGTNVNIGVILSAQSVGSNAVASNVYAAPNMLNVVVPTLSDGEDYQQAIVKQVLALYPDVFDSIVLQYVGMTRAYNYTVGNWPYDTNVKVTETGLGTPTLDNTASYGSAGKLQSVVSLDNEIEAGAFMHEFGHRWCFYLNDPSLKLTDGSNFHVASPTTLIGMMGNTDYLSLQSSGDYLVAQRSSSQIYLDTTYADWELYLMGFLDPSVVGPERFVLDPTVVTTLGSVIPAAKTNLIPISGAPGSQSVVGIYGDRIPTAANSQHAFRVLFVAVSERPLTLAETSIVNRDATYYGSKESWSTTSYAPPTFWSATKNLGTMDTTVPLPK